MGVVNLNLIDCHNINVRTTILFKEDNFSLTCFIYFPVTNMSDKHEHLTFPQMIINMHNITIHFYRKSWVPSFAIVAQGEQLLRKELRPTAFGT